MPYWPKPLQGSGVKAREMSAKAIATTCCLLLITISCSTISNEKRYIKILEGEYVKGEFLTSSSLIINSDRTFTFTNYFDTGVTIARTGQFNVDNNTLSLVFNDNKKSLTMKLIPVVWGDRKYLFNTYEGSEDISKKFCDGIFNRNTSEKEDDKQLFFIYSNKINIGASVFSKPKYLNGKLFCP